MGINDITHQVIDAAMTVHTALGPGLLERAYEACLIHEIKKKGITVESQVQLPVKYDGVEVDIGYRVDLLVEDKVIVELKSAESISKIHKAQLLSYLKMSNMPVGLLINFNVVHLRNGIIRMANKYKD
jgi:GxxExxY protein